MILHKFRIKLLSIAAANKGQRFKIISWISAGRMSQKLKNKIKSVNIYNLMVKC